MKTALGCPMCQMSAHCIGRPPCSDCCAGHGPPSGAHPRLAPIAWWRAAGTGLSAARPRLPLPSCLQIGCTNPRCTNAAGLHDSELTLKTCKACKEAHYCCKCVAMAFCLPSAVLVSMRACNGNMQLHAAHLLAVAPKKGRLGCHPHAQGLPRERLGGAPPAPVRQAGRFEVLMRSRKPSRRCWRYPAASRGQAPLVHSWRWHRRGGAATVIPVARFVALRASGRKREPRL